MMKSKIHRATVTDANLNYVGSISIDPRLMELSDIREWEQVAVVDINNGARFETYAIVGGPGEICLNGAAARLVHPGDMVLNDGPIGAFSINGKTFPATRPVVAKRGQTVLIRYMNEGLMIHPMHLHGMRQQVIAQDGWLLPQPYYCDTLNIAPGQRFEVLVEATERGVWAYHCHILSHAESEHGMFGMVTAFIVEDDEAQATPVS
jgi:L-aspartate-alpha-decarboxylase